MLRAYQRRGSYSIQDRRIAAGNRRTAVESERRSLTSKNNGSSLAGVWPKLKTALDDSELGAGRPPDGDQQMRMDALIDSDARLYLHLQQVDERLARMAESQQMTDKRLARLAESQQRTDEKLARLADTQERTEEKLGRLEDSIQKLVDSWKAGGNGAH